MSIDGVLFDLDDTLIDRSASLSIYARQLWHLAKGDLALDEAAFVDRFLALDGNGALPRAWFFVELAGILGPGFDTASLSAHYDDRAWERPIVMPGAVDGMRQLATGGVSIGIVTNGTSRLQTRKLENSGLLELVDCCVISEQVGASKPDSAMFIAACARLRIDPTRSWMVGSHPEQDILGANEVGMNTIWLERGFSWPGDQPRVYRARVADLSEAFSILRTGTSS